MKSSMVKTTLREIRNSFGRWFAILAIIALGVGFFSGLMMTTPSMLQAGSDYMNGHELYDLRLLSTLGFERGSETAFVGNEEIKAAEGAVSTDFIGTTEDGENRVLSAQTLLKTQNQVEVVEGRLPQTAAECVIDANLQGAPIGSLIRISEENDETRRDLFSQKEYTVVGRVNAVTYAQYERGSSSLGNGKITGFAYLLPEGFESDYYTEIFLRVKQDYTLYDDAYKTRIDSLKDWAKPLTEQAARDRYENILSEADEKLADAQAELEEKTAEGRQELDDARQKIEDSEKELADAEEQIEEGEQQLAQAREELESGRRELENNAARLADGRIQVETGLSQIAQARQQMEAALTALQAAGGQDMAGQAGDAALSQTSYGQLLTQLEALRAQEAQLEAQLAGIEEGEAQLVQGRRSLQEAEAEIADREEELEENRRKLSEAREELEEGRKEYADGEEELAEKTAQAQEEIDDASREIEEIEEPETYVLGRDTNIGYVCFESDSGIVAGIAKVFPIFFFLVAALVCITTMNRMVEEQRTQIGVLKALGYGEASVMGKYLFYSGSAAVIGSIAGFAAGGAIFPTVIWEAYKIMYRMGEIRLCYDWKLAAISLAVALLCSMGATWMTCRYELHSVAAELIRPKAPRNGKRILLERMPFLWGRLSFLVKVSVRNVMRYKRRFFMMVVGIGGCTALLVTGFGIKDSIVDVARQQFEEIQLYEMSLTLSEGGEEQRENAADIALQNGAESYTWVSEKALDLTGPEGTKSVTVIVPGEPERMGEFVNLRSPQGVSLAWPQTGEAVVTDEVAEKCGIEVGDTVLLRNEDGESLHVTVTALAGNYVYNYVYVNADTWEKDNGAPPEFKSLYFNVPQDTAPEKLSESLLECEDVSSVSINADFMERVDNMMSSLDYIVLLIILCAGALAFIVIYNLTNINITERLREIATIKVLGFYPGETAAYVFRENVVLTAIGALAGQGLGVLLHRFVMDRIKVDMVSFDIRILPLSFAKSILLTFLFMAVVDVFMYLKLERIDMAESLKSIE